MTEQLDPKRAFIVRQAIADARAADAKAERLEESYVRLLVLGNAGGLIACFGIADALAGNKESAGTFSLAALTGPMWLFFIGLIFGGLIVSIQQKRAVRESEEHGQKALQAIKDIGLIVPRVPPTFSPIELKAVPHLTTAINILGILSQAFFFLGAVWGLFRIGAGH
ncbi:hypothetical protein [Methylocapsa sp. S129]|uniref:hypothetical protein n=1 Tax=Methylocapsa sp. S129 TaxID=1641869 RepID=UPI00131D3529|nr:hypothetical protein [Methylocapsa sp. S129]